jgi:choline dehydrogenase
MMHIRGHTSDYDEWASGGATGWSYEEVLPWFKKLEGQEDRTSEWTGTDGPLPLTNAGQHDPNPTSIAFLEACAELGYPSTDDFNGPNMIGAGWHHINVVDGKRASAYRGYLAPALDRPNLTFVTNAMASRLVSEDGRCSGLEYVKGGTTHRADASAEVIVCGGAIESPKLLMLSGIGDAAELKAVGIDTLVDLPGVGKNFHNHILSGVIHEALQPVPPGRQNLSEAALFLKADLRDRPTQIAFVHVPFNIIVGQGHPN